MLAFSFHCSGSELTLTNPNPQSSWVSVPLQCCRPPKALTCTHSVANMLAIMDFVILPMSYAFAPNLLVINVGGFTTKEVGRFVLFCSKSTLFPAFTPIFVNWNDIPTAIQYVFRMAVENVTFAKTNQSSYYPLIPVFSCTHSSHKSSISSLFIDNLTPLTPVLKNSPFDFTIMVFSIINFTEILQPGAEPSGDYR